jgi:hypothetical protein
MHRSPESPFRGWPVLSGCRELLERKSALRSLDIEALDRGWRLPDPSGGAPHPEAVRVDRSIGVQRETATLCTRGMALGTRVLLECPGTQWPWTGRPD